jgi:hypothetical protein
MDNRVQLTARGVWDFGKQVEKSGKKALAMVQASEYKDGKLPSGKTYEDYLLFVRQAMYKDFQNSGNDNDDEEDVSVSSGAAGADADSASNEKPDTWFFTGFMSFALWGPLMPDDMDDAHKSDAFFISDLQKQKKSKSDGRSSIRKEEENAASVARSNASFSEGRGLSNKDYLMAASIAQQSSTAGFQRWNRSLFFTNANS